MKQPEEFFRRLIEAFPCPVVGVDDALRVIYWSPAAERELGWLAGDVLGKENPSIPPALRNGSDTMVREVLAGREIRHLPTWRVRRDGSRLDVLLSSAVIRDTRSSPGTVGVYFVLEDLESTHLTAQRELREREAQLRLMLDQLPAVVYTTDMDLNLTSILGSLPQTTAAVQPEVGRNVREFVQEDSEVLHALRAVTGGARLAHYTFVYGDHVYDARVEPLRDGSQQLRGTIVAAFDVTDRHRDKEALRQMAAQMNVLQEEERRRIARELHDEMGQQLTALRLEVDLLRAELGEYAPAERLDAILTLVRDTAATMRRAVSDLRPSILDDFGFRAAVESELTAFQRRTGLPYELILPTNDPPLDRDRTTALFRIIQEALTNVARHAAATRVEVSVRIKDDCVELTVADDGRGITPAEASDTTSLGLVGVHERAWAFGGEVTIEGLPGKGTTLRVRIPLDGDAL